jgi:hypothetical protein
MRTDTKLYRQSLGVFCQISAVSLTSGAELDETTNMQERSKRTRQTVRATRRPSDPIAAIRVAKQVPDEVTAISQPPVAESVELPILPRPARVPCVPTMTERLAHMFGSANGRNSLVDLL